MILFCLIYFPGYLRKALVSSNLNLRVKLGECCFLTLSMVALLSLVLGEKVPLKRTVTLCLVFDIFFLNNSVYFWLVVQEGIQPSLNLYLKSWLSPFCEVSSLSGNVYFAFYSVIRTDKTFNHLL